METMKVPKNQMIAQQKEKVRHLYIILEGSVIQKNSFARVTLGKNAVIGISEEEHYLCDYIAAADSVLAMYPYENPSQLSDIIKGQAGMREILLRAALSQRQMLLKAYASFQALVHKFHFFVENQYNDYTNLCLKYSYENTGFPRIDNFKPIEMTHKAEDWEINNSSVLMEKYQQEYIQLMQKDDALCIGAILEAARQTRRVTQGIVEMAEYLEYNQDILLADSANDIFHLYFDLLTSVGANGYDTKPLTSNMDRTSELIKILGIYDNRLVSRRMQEYQNYKTNGSAGAASGASGTAAQWQKSDFSGDDYLLHILDYAELEKEKYEEFYSQIKEYRELPDMLSTDSSVQRLRKSLTSQYYDIYYKVFTRALKEEADGLSPIIQMFLNFGFMDVHLAGEENTSMLYDLTDHLSICRSSHIYTIYTWLKSIYEGKNEPSKNEFDLDYSGYLAELRKSGSLTAAQVTACANDPDMKLKFELQNMFVSGNRVTYGKISTFCPILCEYDLINSVEKMLVTVQKLEDSIEKIKEIDFSIFYREVAFSDPAKGINLEQLQKEVMPDIILMPNAGTRAMMWQEIAGRKRDSSARFMFPIFTAVDIDDMMIDTLGRYRWEICRRIQGVHWNDIREPSLTADYCDYIQFYRKNNELSADAKEKIKLALQRGRNNYREVFVKDYQNWIKFEAKGSFRLNKIARDILLKYCPFSKAIREELKANPMYQNAFQRYEILNAKTLQRVTAVFSKYQKAGGQITQDIKNHLDFFSL